MATQRKSVSHCVMCVRVVGVVWGGAVKGERFATNTVAPCEGAVWASIVAHRRPNLPMP